MQPKSKKERKQLEENLTALVIKFNANEDIYKNIVSDLKDKMNEGEVAKIWSVIRPLRVVTDMELLLFAQSMYKQVRNENINPKTIFSDNDFNEALHVYKKKNLSQETITLKNVNRVNDEIWDVPFIACREIVTAFDNGIINYNLEAQREAEKKKVLGEEILVPKIFDQKTKEIAEELINNTYIPVDSLIINILKTGAENIDYNDITKELTLHKVEGSTNDLIDGGNRSEACRLALTMNSKLDNSVGFSLKVTNFTLAKAQKCIQQINKQTPINKDRIKSFEPTKYMKIAKELNTMEDSETNILWQRLGDSINDLRIFNKVSTIQLLAESIEDSFKDILDKQTTYTDILDYLFEFFNEYFTHFHEYMENPEKSRKTSVLLDVNMFFVHTQVAKELYNQYLDKKRIWRQKVREVANHIDFSKTNQEWEILKTTGNLSLKNKEILVDYVINKINECFKEEG